MEKMINRLSAILLLTAIFAKTFGLFAQGINCGVNHTVGFCTDSLPVSWGLNDYGRLGNGSITKSNSVVRIPGIGRIQAIDGGVEFSIALAEDSTVWTWGRNNFGQLGIGTTQDEYHPVQVPGLDSIVAISAGGDHSLALKADGKLYAWGMNLGGQIGDGTNNNALLPVQVPGMTNVQMISAGGYFSLAVLANGSLFAWGTNAVGQLGDGTTTNRNFPALVPGIGTVVAIKGGGFHSLVIKPDSTVWGWGENTWGELGLGAASIESSAVQIPGMTSAIGLGAGHWHSFVRQAGGNCWVFGLNDAGQLGLGDQVDRLVPVLNPAFFGAQYLDGGALHSAALMTGGNVVTVGGNLFGQLGYGDFLEHLQPIQPFAFCSPDLSVEDQLFETIFANRQTSGTDWIAGELNSSLKLRNGKTMLIMGRSHIKVPASPGFIDCTENIDNCLLVQDDDTLNQINTLIDNSQIDKSFFKTPTSPATRYEPRHGFYNHDTLVVFLSEMQGDSFVGNQAARIGGVTTYDILDIGRPNPPGLDIDFGNAVIVDSVAGYAYIFGIRKDPSGLGQWMPYLARCPHDNVYGTWEVSDGNGAWSSNFATARPISPHAVGPGYSAFKKQGRFYLVFQEQSLPTEGCGGNVNMVALRCNQVDGQYALPKLLSYSRDSLSTMPLRAFRAYAHPQLSWCDSLLVSYNINDEADTLAPNECVGQCLRGSVRDMASWRPQFVKVPFIALDSNLNGNVVADFTSYTVGNDWHYINQSENARSFVWDFGDGNSSTLPNPVHRYANSGNYPVSLQAFGCADTNQVVSTITRNTVMAGMSGVWVNVFPNPSKGDFNIIANGIQPGHWSITIHDLMGRQVYSATVMVSNPNLVARINLAQGPGIYVLRLEKGGMLFLKLLEIVN